VKAIFFFDNKIQICSVNKEIETFRATTNSTTRPAKTVQSLGTRRGDYHWERERVRENGEMEVEREDLTFLLKRTNYRTNPVQGSSTTRAAGAGCAGGAAETAAEIRIKILSQIKTRRSVGFASQVQKWRRTS
jgi:hypothetical protein